MKEITVLFNDVIIFRFMNVEPTEFTDDVHSAVKGKITNSVLFLGAVPRIESKITV